MGILREEGGALVGAPVDVIVADLDRNEYFKDPYLIYYRQKSWPVSDELLAHASKIGQ
jgi:hypothetical protein